MTTPAPRPRSVRRDILALLTLCALTGFIGLTDHGVTNWQEGIRLFAAQEMHERGDWVVPTVHGIPYLAKPPLIYWGQLALSPLTGGRVTLATLRLLVALAGTASVLLLYLFVRRAMSDPDQQRPGAVSDSDPTFAGSAAFWSAATLATGILFVRNMRIGELDILIVPPAIVTIWALYEAWRAHECENRTNWGAVAVACVAIGLCALAKGPPAVLTPLLAAYGAIAVRHAFGDRPTPTVAVAAAAAMAALAAFGVSVRAVTDLNSVIGALAFGVIAAFAVVLCARLLRPRAAKAVLIAGARTHPLAVAAAGAAALWLWSLGVDATAGGGVSESIAKGEAADNLLVFVLDAPARTLEFLGYAGGAASISCIAGLFWLGLARPQLGRAGWIALAWVILPLIAFSCLGKGVQRYLVPTLPGVAMLGGIYIAHALRSYAGPTFVRAFWSSAVVLLALGQGVWYGFVRDDRFAARSPRDMVAELGERHGYDPERLASLDLWTPAIDIYCGAPVIPYHQIDDTYDHPHPVADVAELVRLVREEGGRWTVFVRAEPNRNHPDLPAARDRLAALGMIVQDLPLESEFAIDKLRAPVVPVRVWWPE